MVPEIGSSLKIGAPSKIGIFQRISDGEMTKTKVLNLKKVCNFLVDNFFHLKSSLQRKLHLNFSRLKFKIFK